MARKQKPKARTPKKAARKAAPKRAPSKASRKVAKAKTARKPLKAKKIAKKVAKKVAGRKGAGRRAKPKVMRRVATAPKARPAAKRVVKAKVAARPKAAPKAKAAAPKPKAATKPAPQAKPKASRAVMPAALPRLDRERRRLPEAELEDFVGTGDDARLLQSARSGHDELRSELQKHTEASLELTAGDVDANWQDAYAIGDEAPGGDSPTPDQDRVDDIGKALGVVYDDDQELMGGDEIAARDVHRWELDPGSKDDDEI